MMNPSDELAGHTFEELSDYLDRDRTPADPSIDGFPECEIALRGMQRLRRTQRALLRKDVERESEREDSWVNSILQHINLEARAGRDIPISHPSPTARLSVTEGAVRGILRAAGDGVPNIIVGRCRLDGEVSEPGAPVTVRVDATVLEGKNIPPLAEQLREALYTALSQHTELAVEAVDITIRDLYQPVPPPAKAKASSDE
ncbi:Asp23/Gls24 family envelope stress response protein [Cryobacterium sp. TMT1-62]|uniref:Asp23/Gls24 family envelope stress response protein n=1 Tax=unclassified Cryobacterium TaxID=2649013 RepID=UPI000CE2E798|nr:MULTISPECIES: Asp23/Gls24 family envelope stress response protein [unclassified Cryobacterium]TFB54727.1 Asp23/Gls24 family envelope stress response protein [Cryobacterium sp. Sr3]TFD29751.1 Asp23/Gls24 family envelope stress response protein [Cryobacterium sp. TMT1-62]